MLDTSTFFTEPVFLAKDNVSTFKLLHSSEHGFCDIFRIDRAGRFRVLKCLKPEYRGNALYENLLRKEFEIGYSLDHPNVCEYYDYSPVEGLGNCIEMEWVDGRPLEDMLSGQEMDKAVSDHVLDGICDALTYIHTKQILHRDLKPSNILVTFKGDNVKLIDFGLSDSDAHSILKSPAGTLEYTAPEIINGSKADVRSDIYSLGMIMFRMSRKYRRVARRCCERRPYRRYSSAAAVKKAIHSNMSLYAGVLFILLIAFFAIVPLLESLRKDVPQSESLPTDSAAVVTPIELESPDISTETPAPAPVHEHTPAPIKKAATTPAPASKTEQAAEQEKAPAASLDTVDASTIDELFRQATELFD